MNIFVIFLLIIGNLLGIKNKLHVYIKFDNFEIYVEIKGKFININRKGTLRKKNKESKLKNSKTKNKLNINVKKITKSLNSIEIEKLNINVLFGAIFLLPTVYAIPIISTLLEHIKVIPFKKLKNYKYIVIPVYNEPKLICEINTTIKVSFFDLIKVGLISFKAQ